MCTARQGRLEKNDLVNSSNGYRWVVKDDAGLFTMVTHGL